MYREYRALVKGYPGKKGTWKAFLRENKQLFVHVCPPSQGKEAITHYETLEKRGDHSLLKLKLQTGRKHQIRVHCKDAGHPIAGDKRYGSPSCNPINRICLHASLLEFLHPLTGKKMSFSAPIPSRFSQLGISSLEKKNKVL